MALYIAEGNVYFVDADGTAHGADVTAKDKVVEVRSLESVTVAPKAAKVTLPDGAIPVTEDEMVRILNLSEENPCRFAEKAKAKKAKEE